MYKFDLGLSEIICLQYLLVCLTISIHKSHEILHICQCKMSVHKMMDPLDFTDSITLSLCEINPYLLDRLLQN